jgi:hypothetical protein
MIMRLIAPPLPLKVPARKSSARATRTKSWLEYWAAPTIKLPPCVPTDKQHSSGDKKDALPV